jgi:DNA polymerase-3 subunit epsilon
MNYAILDIETTGRSPKYEKITEIAVYIHNGTEIVDEFSTLLNPERTIPSFITGLTGITNEMVANAPKFFEIAKKLVELTEDCIIVGHNVNFDYSFIKNEFKLLGYDYAREVICTVKLSRKLIPGFKSYSLGKLCEQLKIQINGRHRAAGDAFATVKLFELLMERDVNSSHRQISSPKSEGRLKNLNGFLTPDKIHEVPAATGVYYLHDNEGNLLYVGKSKNIHNRILSHLANKSSRRAIELSNKIASISYDLTGSELIALLLESAEIKKHKPLYNRAQRRTSAGWGLYTFYDNKGYINFEVKKAGEKNSIPVTGFNNKKEGISILTTLVEKYWLCQKLSGLYHTDGSCFHHDIRQCNGACVGKEAASIYNERAKKLIKSFEFEVDNVLVIDKGRTGEERSLVLIEKGFFRGYGFFEIDQSYLNIEDLKECIKKADDNRESRFIIKSWLRRNNPEKLLYF